MFPPPHGNLYFLFFLEFQVFLKSDCLNAALLKFSISQSLLSPRSTPTLYPQFIHRYQNFLHRRTNVIPTLLVNFANIFIPLEFKDFVQSSTLELCLAGC